MCCRKVQGHSPLAFCESPKDANETNGTLVREEKKKVNRISRIPRVKKQKVEKEMEVTKMMVDTKSDQK